MLVLWSRHAKLRFAERVLMYGINYGDIELEIKRQKVKVKEGKNKFKTIFPIENQKMLLTALKKEKNEYIHVLTLWEASEQEVEVWKKKKK
jgi:adenylate kinase